VVIGGAGGLGEAWTRHVIEHYQAQVIWVGRREPDDAAIAAKLQALARLGPAPIYFTADASDLDSLREVHGRNRQRWPQIHGVIHAAVGAFDRSIAESDEEQFRTVLSPKLDAGINIFEVFSAEPLDFL